MSNRQITHLWGEGFYGEGETLEVTAAITMSSAPTVMYVIDRIDSFGASAHVATSTMTVEGGREVLGSATLSSTAYSLGEGETIKTGGSTFYGKTTLTASGGATAFGASTTTSDSTVVVVGTRTQFGASTFTLGRGTMSVANVFQVAQDTVTFTEEPYDIFRFDWEETSV